MPTSVSELFREVGLEVMGQVRWEQKSKSIHPGVYVVAITADPNIIATKEAPPISLPILEDWIGDIATLQLNKERPTAQELNEELSGFWLPDETVLYIGKTDRPLKVRISEYYNTKLGKAKPHAGGHWLKTLSILSELSIYWCECLMPEEKEKEMMDKFIGGVSETTHKIIKDPDHPYPFANLEYLKIVKKHGVSGAIKK